MKRLFIITLAVCSMLMATSCKDKRFKGYDKTENGLYYKFLVENKDARAPQQGDFLFITVSYRTDNDSIVFDPRDVIDQMQPSIYTGDLYEAYGLMHEGDEASFIMKADTLFHYMGWPEIPSFITDESVVYFTIKLNRIAGADEIKAEKSQEIDKYITDHNLTATPTESGLYFIEQKAGKGGAIQDGDTLSIHYTFKLINDTIFDSSLGKNPMPCIAGRMFPGMDEGLKLMKRGGKALMIMPYDIAFGVQNPYIPVPPFSTIIAEIEVLPTFIRPEMPSQPIE